MKKEGRREGGRDGANERCWLLALASMGKEGEEEEEENRKGAFNMGDPGGREPDIDDGKDRDEGIAKIMNEICPFWPRRALCCIFLCQPKLT